MNSPSRDHAHTATGGTPDGAATEVWPIRRQNADYDRHIKLADALRSAWRSGERSWIDLAGIALTMLKAPRADADATFTIELCVDRSSVRSEAQWGGEPEKLLRRAIAALEAELADLHLCPHHKALAEQPHDEPVASDKSREAK